MKLLLDENLSYKTADFLIALGHDVKTVFDLNLVGASDEEVFSKAVSTRRILVTLDSDFGEIFYFGSKDPCQIITLKVPDQTIENVNSVLESILSAIKKLKLKNSLIIVDRNKIRVIKKP